VDFRVKPSAGLGAYPSSQISLDSVAESQGSERWFKAQDRFARLNAAAAADSDTAHPTALATNFASAKSGQIKWVKGQQK